MVCLQELEGGAVDGVGDGGAAGGALGGLEAFGGGGFVFDGEGTQALGAGGEEILVAAAIDPKRRVRGFG